MDTADLQETAVLPRLPTRWLGRPYYYHATIGSTNEWLKQLVAAGGVQEPPTGTVVLANFQSQGRGRLNRRWEAPPGTSLLFSVLLRPLWPPERANWLTMMAGLAALRAVEAVCPLPGATAAAIKWPNDVMVGQDGAWRKVGGLLLEGELDDHGRYASAIIGIGLNVNVAPDQLPPAATPPTSLLAATGQPVSRQALLLALLAELERLVDAAETGASPHRAWEARLMTLGQTVQVREMGNGRVLYGTATGTDPWGHLLITDAAGQTYTITAGDVTLCPLA